jgi:S-adenosylmethionine decarboxylase
MKAQMFNYNKWIELTEPASIKLLFDNILEKSGFKILGFIDYHFNPYGYTALWLLGESHFAIHTFPEHSKSYIELSSCVIAPYNKFIKAL